MREGVKAASASVIADPSKRGRRETNKRAKALRIRAAATSLFHTRGYRATTMNMIGAAANVASGTLFLYAANKRDLLLLIINDELEVLTADTFSQVNRKAPLLDQLMHVFAARYRYWGVDPALSLRALQEVLVPQPGDDAATSQYTRYQERRQALIANIEELLEEQKRSGYLRTDADPAVLAKVIMAVHLSVVRSWLRTPAPSVGSGIAELRELLTVAIGGSLSTNDLTPA